MRVIAGKARSLPLKTIPGMDTRPTTDRIKETLFNMLQSELCEARFLDLFAGSGAIGIEALSRGAKEAVFVESSRRAADCIRQNLAFTRLASQATVLNTDAESALKSLEGKGSFDLIFMDPPYNHLLEKQVLEYLAHSSLADEHTLIVVEASLETDFDYLEELGYTAEKRKCYKTNVHLFCRRTEGRA
ncbi:MAG: 16S rRNA (guanine(966)-N(2))-methyltransferase RsmD [Candidatus Limivivens sp.]|nr:16S rRNA (guanine(966)-N(2))-methyltransferase RsmD [Candidatus Limivivens sp.]